MKSLANEKMMYSLRVLLIATVVAHSFFFIGCSDTNIVCPPQQTSGQIVPLAVGNQWINKVTVYKDEYGAIGSSYYDTVKIYEDTLVNGESLFYYDGFAYCTNHPDGLWTYGYIDTAPPMLWFKYPANKGDSITIAQGSHVYITVTSIDTVVQCPYGCFFTYEYNFHDNSQEKHYFFAPGIGLIREEVWYNGLTHWYKLRQYELTSVELH